jgi:hypothetical protein
MLQGAVRRLARGVEDGPIDVKEPAVIAAPDAFLRHQTKLQRGTTMWAMEF